MKIPIGKQCSSIRLLIRAAESHPKMRKAELDHMKPQWEAALESLTWLALNEEKIKKALSDASREQPSSEK